MAVALARIAQHSLQLYQLLVVLWGTGLSLPARNIDWVKAAFAV